MRFLARNTIKYRYDDFYAQYGVYIQARIVGAGTTTYKSSG